MKKFKLFSFLLVLFIAIFIWGALSVENKNTSPFVNSIKSIIPQNIKATLKNTLFIIPTLSKKVESQKNRIIELEAKFLELSKQVNYLIDKLELKQNLSKNIKSKLNTYNISSYKLPFLTRKEGHGKPAAYLEQKGNNILIATGRGEFFTFKKEDIESKTLNLKKIKSNIKNVIKNEEFYSKGKIGIRDLMILDNKIYFSYIKEQKYGCYNTSIIFSEFNLNNLNFSEFFSYSDCVSQKIITEKYGDGYLSLIHSGGRMFPFKDGKIIFTTGYLGHYLAAQDENSMFGKIISIDLKTKNYEILVKGSRNAQGLYYDKENSIIISTEHGPKGGDEININLKPDTENIENYGWPISSYGEPQPREPWLLKNPPEKSHEDKGFIEPIKYYVPSISISQIVRAPETFKNDFKNDFFISTLGFKSQINEGDQSIHHIRLDDTFKKIIFEDVIPIGERIRDLIYVEEKKAFLMILETIPAIAILK